MSQPTFVFTYEIHYKGQISITADDQTAAQLFWSQLQLANLVTNAAEPTVNLLNVQGGVDSNNDPFTYDD